MSAIPWDERKAAGLLLILGFILLMVTAALFATGGSAAPGLQNATLTSGLVVTLLGLATLELVVRGAGENVLGRLATIAFLVGAVVWIVTDTLALRGLPWVFEAERDYVVLACFAVAIFGWAFLRTGVLPGWIGWTAIVWATGWLVLYLTRLLTAPLVPNMMTFLFGVLLLRRTLPGQTMRTSMPGVSKP